MKKFQKIVKFRLLLPLAVLMVACTKKGEEPQPSPLTLDKTSLEMVEGASAAKVTIKSGNGGYTVTSSAPKVATAEIVGNDVKITPVAPGVASVTVRDKAQGSVQIAVKVLSKALENSARRFEWGNTSVIFGVNTDWTIAGKPGEIEVVNIKTKTSYYLTWSGGGGEGKKSNAKLYKNVESIELPSAELFAKDGTHYLVFGNGTTNGVLVYR